MQTQIVNALANIRREWEKAAEGTSLIEVEGNVGLILADVINTFGLTPDEQAKALGSHLYRDLLPYLIIPTISMAG